MLKLRFMKMKRVWITHLNKNKKKKIMKWKSSCKEKSSKLLLKVKLNLMIQFFR